MAGACAHILLRHALSDVDRNEVRRYIDSVASSVAENAFWIAGQPFIWSDEAVNASLASTPQGWRPQGVIEFCAMCRGHASEAYLAMLVARVAQQLDGLIALGGRIDSLTSDSFLVMEGRYPTDDEDLVTPAFLHFWVNHPNFRMFNQ